VFTIGSPAHALAVEHTLRPLLVELGASVPTRGLAFETARFESRADIIAEWLEQQKRVLR
jgi:FMN reductase